MPRSPRRQRATSSGDTANPLVVRSLSAYSPAQQRLLRALLEAERTHLERGAGAATSRAPR
jgi:hypothetical protein